MWAFRNSSCVARCDRKFLRLKKLKKAERYKGDNTTELHLPPVNYKNDITIFLALFYVQSYYYFFLIWFRFHVLVVFYYVDQQESEKSINFGKGGVSAEYIKDFFLLSELGLKSDVDRVQTSYEKYSWVKTVCIELPWKRIQWTKKIPKQICTRAQQLFKSSWKKINTVFINEHNTHGIVWTIYYCFIPSFQFELS